MLRLHICLYAIAFFQHYAIYLQKCCSVTAFLHLYNRLRKCWQKSCGNSPSSVAQSRNPCPGMNLCNPWERYVEIPNTGIMRTYLLSSNLVWKLRKSNFEGPQLYIRDFFSSHFTDSFVHNIAEVRSDVAYAHFWLFPYGTYWEIIWRKFAEFVQCSSFLSFFVFLMFFFNYNLFHTA